MFIYRRKYLPSYIPLDPKLHLQILLLVNFLAATTPQILLKHLLHLRQPLISLHIKLHRYLLIFLLQIWILRNLLAGRTVIDRVLHRWLGLLTGWIFDATRRLCIPICMIILKIPMRTRCRRWRRVLLLNWIWLWRAKIWRRRTIIIALSTYFFPDLFLPLNRLQIYIGHDIRFKLFLLVGIWGAAAEEAQGVRLLLHLRLINILVIIKTITVGLETKFFNYRLLFLMWITSLPLSLTFRINPFCIIILFIVIIKFTSIHRRSLF